MCGRYTLIGPARLRDAFPEYTFPEFSEYRLPRFNIAPSQRVAGVLADGSATARPLTWGIDGRINVRAERLRSQAPARRCILFADGFYEWRDHKPARFRLRADEPFAFAGVWQPGPGGDPACAIVTVEANALVAQVHHRMPAILNREQRARWMQSDTPNSAELAELLRPFDAEGMQMDPASTRLNSARYDAPDVLRDDDPVQERLF